MTAGERIFIDLLPDTWKGMPPGLPQDVVKELSERARAAERALRQQRAAAESQKKPPIRVRASVQPTFVRFVFETGGVGVSSVLNEKTLTLTFNAGLVFDLADAKLSAPANVASIGQAMDGNRTAVEIGLIGDVDVKSFREDKSYVVDIGFQQNEKPSPLAKLPVAAPADEKPPVAVKPPEVEKPASVPAQRSGEIVPPTSETIAKRSFRRRRSRLRRLHRQRPSRQRSRKSQSPRRPRSLNHPSLRRQPSLLSSFLPKKHRRLRLSLRRPCCCTRCCCVDRTGGHAG